MGQTRAIHAVQRSAGITAPIRIIIRHARPYYATRAAFRRVPGETIPVTQYMYTMFRGDNRCLGTQTFTR